MVSRKQRSCCVLRALSWQPGLITFGISAPQNSEIAHVLYS
jgi:hypothetical protein